MRELVAQHQELPHAAEHDEIRLAPSHRRLEIADAAGRRDRVIESSRGEEDEGEAPLVLREVSIDAERDAQRLPGMLRILQGPTRNPDSSGPIENEMPGRRGHPAVVVVVLD